MTQQRRDFLRQMALAGLAGSAAVTAPAAEAPKADATLTHDMTAFPPEWLGKEQIAMLIYPDFTALDMVGPHYMFTSLWGAKVNLVAASREPVRSDAGLVFTPNLTLEEAPVTWTSCSFLAAAPAPSKPCRMRA